MFKGWQAVVLLLAFVLTIAGCSKVQREEKVAKEEIGHIREEWSGEIIWRVKTNEKIVALTFDDGPDPNYTPTVLQLAREKGARFTFFLVGREIQLHPELARQEVAEGHVIGNHSWDHPKLTTLNQGHNITEIKRCEQEIEKICGKRTHLFRPPYGLWDGDTFLAAEQLGYRIILWSVALEHHSAKTPQQMAQRVINMVRPGMIILAHDGEPCGPIDRDKTVEALPILINGLQKKGYRFVTLPELLERAK